MIPRIREVHIRNYKSIEQASVTLAGFTVLVGANGSGKSNFVDALAFVQECLSTSIEAAFRKRGGAFGVAHQFSIGDSVDLELRIVIDLDDSTCADYGFGIYADLATPPEIFHEACRIIVDGEEKHAFEVKRGTFVNELAGVRPVVEPGRLMLYAASVTPEFHPVYAFLSGIRVYAIQPDVLRTPRGREAGLELETMGQNAASVLRVLEERFADRHARIVDVLSSVVPGILSVWVDALGSRELISFTEGAEPEEQLVSMDAFNLSDGTLRMLGMLLAVYQPTTPTVLLVEEPEATIHPAAADVLVSVLMDAAKRSQVVITTHSPDLLDNKEIAEDMVRVVSKSRGRTAIASMSNASRTAVRQNLYSLGELLRVDELNPAPTQPGTANESIFRSPGNGTAGRPG